MSNPRLRGDDEEVMSSHRLRGDDEGVMSNHRLRGDDGEVMSSPRLRGHGIVVAVLLADTGSMVFLTRLLIRINSRFPPGHYTECPKQERLVCRSDWS